eukprot:8369440-Pyramimonas_sp.AAC.1
MTAIAHVAYLLVAFGFHAHAYTLPGSWAINYEDNITYGFGLPRTGRALLQQNKNVGPWCYLTCSDVYQRVL